jgi:site-specific recombinase XerD
MEKQDMGRVLCLRPATEDWRELVRGFLSLRAASTRAQYFQSLREFEEVIGHELLNATEADVYKFSEWALAKKGYKSRMDPNDKTASRITVKSKLVCLQNLYLHLAKQDLCHGNPFEGPLRLFANARAGEKRPTGALTVAQVRKLLEMPGGDREGIRDRAVLSLLFGAGLRISEVLKLNVADVGTSPEGTVYLRLKKTKAGRTQEHALQDWVADSIKKLLAQRRGEGAGEFDGLIAVYRSNGEVKNNRTRYDTFYRWMTRWVREAGLPVSVTSHFGRATAITQLLSQGLNYREVQEFSRHSSVRLVELYDKRRFSLEDAPQKKLKY